MVALLPVLLLAVLGVEQLAWAGLSAPLWHAPPYLLLMPPASPVAWCRPLQARQSLLLAGSLVPPAAPAALLPLAALGGAVLAALAGPVPVGQLQLLACSPP